MYTVRLAIMNAVELERNGFFFFFLPSLGPGGVQIRCDTGMSKIKLLVVVIFYSVSQPSYI